MDKNLSDSLLIIFERQLEDRFNNFKELTKVECYNCKLENIYGKNIFYSIYQRIKYRKKLINAKSEILKKLKYKKVIYVSNGEGFIALNMIEFIKKNSKAKIVCLQHGVFELLDWNFFEIFLKKFINNATKLIFGIKVIGLGFGYKIADKYVVYCNPYKDFLVNKGWSNSDVIVSSYFLKGVDYNKNKAINYPISETKVLLAMQPMSAMNLMSKKDEHFLYKKLLKILVSNFEVIYIRQHPYCDVEVPIVESSKIIKTTNSTLKDDIDKVDIVVSFMSSALVDYENANKKFISVYSNKLKKYKSSYIAFKYIFMIDSSNNNNFNYKKNKNRKTKFFYETGLKSYKELVEVINYDYF